MKQLGPEHVDVAAVYNNLGNVYHELNNFVKANECVEHSIAIRLKTQGPEHVDIATTYVNMGNLQFDMGNMEQAKEYYERALAIRMKHFGPDDVDVVAVRRSLVRLDTATEKSKRCTVN